jgi:hypothetical protein
LESALLRHWWWVAIHHYGIKSRKRGMPETVLSLYSLQHSWFGGNVVLRFDPGQGEWRRCPILGDFFGTVAPCQLSFARALRVNSCDWDRYTVKWMRGSTPRKTMIAFLYVLSPSLFLSPEHVFLFLHMTLFLPLHGLKLAGCTVVDCDAMTIYSSYE